MGSLGIYCRFFWGIFEIFLGVFGIFQGCRSLLGILDFFGKVYEIPSSDLPLDE